MDRWCRAADISWAMLRSCAFNISGSMPSASISAWTMESESISGIVRSLLLPMQRPIVNSANFHTSCYRGGAGHAVSAS